MDTRISSGFRFGATSMCMDIFVWVGHSEADEYGYGFGIFVQTRFIDILKAMSATHENILVK
jgi:hypothetical protein